MLPRKGKRVDWCDYTIPNLKRLPKIPASDADLWPLAGSSNEMTIDDWRKLISMPVNKFFNDDPLYLGPYFEDHYKYTHITLTGPAIDTQNMQPFDGISKYDSLRLGQDVLMDRLYPNFGHQDDELNQDGDLKFNAKLQNMTFDFVLLRNRMGRGEFECWGYFTKQQLTPNDTFGRNLQGDLCYVRFDTNNMTLLVRFGKFGKLVFDLTDARVKMNAERLSLSSRELNILNDDLLFYTRCIVDYYKWKYSTFVSLPANHSVYLSESNVLYNITLKWINNHFSPNDVGTIIKLSDILFYNVPKYAQEFVKPFYYFKFNSRINDNTIFDSTRTDYIMQLSGNRGFFLLIFGMLPWTKYNPTGTTVYIHAKVEHLEIVRRPQDEQAAKIAFGITDIRRPEGEPELRLPLGFDKTLRRKRRLENEEYERWAKRRKQPPRHGKKQYVIEKPPLPGPRFLPMDVLQHNVLPFLSRSQSFLHE